MPSSNAQHHGALARYVAMPVIVAALSACDPYACKTDARSAEYTGRLGETVAPAGDIPSSQSGRIFVGLNEWRGSDSQRNVVASVTVKGFATAVSEIHVHEGTPAAPGRLLWSTSHGYLVGDTIWNAYTDLFHGPAPWSDFWGALDAGHAYFEVHTPTGGSVTGALRQQSVSPFAPACT